MAAPSEPRLDPGAVYRVVRLVGSSPEGWEAAAQAGIAELAKTISDLRLARATEFRAIAGEGGITTFRVMLEASYRIDRRRVSAGAVVEVTRLLLIGNETLGMPALARLLDERIAAGPIEVHILAPVNPGGWGAVAALGDPGSGYVPAGVSMIESRDETLRAAEERVRVELTRLRQAGVAATGELALDDPVDAVVRVLERSSFDEIVVSTLPSSVSRLLRIDFPSRLRRRVRLPVIEVTNA